jgi:hypothetical protein
VAIITKADPLEPHLPPTISNGFVALVAGREATRRRCVARSRAGVVWIIEPNNPVPYKKLMDLPAGVFLRGLTWVSDGSSIIVGRYCWSGDIFLAERSTTHVTQT